MTFNPNIFAQAAQEVASKSMVSQIGHSRLFHSTRSAFSSAGSLASKTSGALIGAGKLFLTLIPVPVVGALVGAAVEAMESGVRGKLHGDVVKHLEQKEIDGKLGKGDKADLIKYSTKELTVENLDRYRWKVVHSIEALNEGLRSYNEITRTRKRSCNDYYAIAMLVAQYNRRKHKLSAELQQFRDVIRRVDEWIEELDKLQGVDIMRQTEVIKTEVNAKINKYNKLVAPLHNAEIAAAKLDHSKCDQWCYLNKKANAADDSSWSSVKSYLGTVAMAMAPIAANLVSVKQGDFKNDTSNSSFKVQASNECEHAK